ARRQRPAGSHWFSRFALGLVRAGGALDRVKRPVLKLAGLRGAAAGELLAFRAQRPAAAAAAPESAALRCGEAAHVRAPAAALPIAAIARAPPLIDRAGAAAVVPRAIVAILSAVLSQVLVLVVAARLILPLRLARVPRNRGISCSRWRRCGCGWRITMKTPKWQAKQKWRPRRSGP